MPRFAVNLSMVFTEYPALERFDRAAAAGFDAVEFLFPYDQDIASIGDALARNGLTQVLFNLPAGDFAAGQRGIANDPARVAEFRDGVERALEIAARLGVGTLNCLVGLDVPGVSRERQWETAAENLAHAAGRAEAAGVRQVVEPLNRFDAPGFLIGTTAEALALIDRAGHPNLALQYDVYHAQRVEGNLVETIRANIGRIGHVQVADTPGRHQPGTGEIAFPFVFAALEEVGYTGHISGEYVPLGPSEASFGWFEEWRERDR